VLITPEYRALNERLHNDNPFYGGKPDNRRIRAAISLIDGIKAKTILDYGCGKGTVHEMCEEFLSAAYWQPKWTDYDPCVPQFSSRPEPAEAVLCMDVLEHIEPECLDDVFKDIRHLARVQVLFTGCCIPAKKTLSDGRNAHLIQQPSGWWLKRITDHFAVLQFVSSDDGAFFQMIGRSMP